MLACYWWKEDGSGDGLVVVWQRACVSLLYTLVMSSRDQSRLCSRQAIQQNMEQLLHYERVAISAPVNNQPGHLRHINNGKGKCKPRRNPVRRKKQSQVKNRPAETVPVSGISAPHSSQADGDHALQTTLDDIVPDGVASTTHSSDGQTWTQRQEAEAENWGEVRGSFYEDAVFACAVPSGELPCSACGDPASVICRNCPAAALCQSCDIEHHTLQPFHKRRHWANGFLQPMAANVSVTHEGEFIRFDPVLPLHGCRTSCETCSDKLVMHASTTTTVCINALGSFDLRLPLWTCRSCQRDTAVTNVDLARCGFYRASPVKMTTVVHEDVFVMWRELKFRSPGTSFKAYCKTLQELGRTYGSSGTVDSDRLQKAYTEWTCLQYELERMTSSDRMMCEACGPEPQLVHLDGNAKLYRYRSAGSGDVSSAYHRGTFIEDCAAVNAHVDKTNEVTKASNRCGNSSWAAGRNDARRLPSKKSQDETGLIVATCRHSMILGGVNMYRGELYAYSHFLHQKRFPNVQYFASDIVCKYWPWTQRVASRFPEYQTGQTKPFLSVMHAKGHAYYCQITYGGFWQPESGWSIMETTEIANAFLSRASNTTKYMTSALRIDSLTALVMDYNRDKHRRLPDLLAKRRQDAEQRIPELEEKLEAQMREHGVLPGELDEIVEELRSLAAALSVRDTRSNGTGLENAIEMVSDSWRARRSDVANTASSAKMRSATRRLMASDHKKLEKLLQRYRSETDDVIQMKDAEEGVFPWHAHSIRDDTVTLSAKRAMCDTLMRLCRSKEELGIVGEEIQRFLAASSGAIDALLHSLALIEEQLSRPEDERLWAVEPPASTDRYHIQHPSTALLYGLRAIIREAVHSRQEYHHHASTRLAPYICTSAPSDMPQ